MSLFQALSLAPVTVVSPTLATQSLFVLAIAHFTLTRLESVTMPLVIGTTLTVVGVALVVLAELPTSTRDLKPIMEGGCALRPNPDT